MAAAIMMLSCGNAAEPENNSKQSSVEQTQYQDEGINNNTRTKNENATNDNNVATANDGKSKKVNDKPVHLTKDEFLKKVMNYQVNKLHH